MQKIATTEQDNGRFRLQHTGGHGLKGEKRFGRESHDFGHLSRKLTIRDFIEYVALEYREQKKWDFTRRDVPREGAETVRGCGDGGSGSSSIDNLSRHLRQ
jgi:hypothetical protein